MCFAVHAGCKIVDGFYQNYPDRNFDEYYVYFMASSKTFAYTYNNSIPSKTFELDIHTYVLKYACSVKFVG